MQTQKPKIGERELAELSRGIADRLGPSAQYTEAERLDYFSRAAVLLLGEVTTLRRAQPGPD